MAPEELEKERDLATGKVAIMVEIAREIESKEGLSLEIDRYAGSAKGKLAMEGYFFRCRCHDLTGTSYGSETSITESEAREARRLGLTYLFIPGVDDER